MDINKTCLNALKILQKLLVLGEFLTFSDNTWPPDFGNSKILAKLWFVSLL